MITTLKTSLPFEPALKVLTDVVASTGTTEGFKPELGVLSFVPYLPAKVRFVGHFSATPTQGEVTVNVKAEGTVLTSLVVGAVNGLDVISGSLSVPLSGVSGSDKLDVELDVTTATQAGVNCKFSAVIDIEQAIAAGSC